MAEGRTPLHDAAAANMVDTAEIVRRLLLAGADPNAKRATCRTPPPSPRVKAAPALPPPMKTPPAMRES